jgi:hypothetical protein
MEGEKMGLSSKTEMDFGHSFIYLREDGIIQINCSDNFEYEVEHIKENLAAIKQLSGDKKVLVLNMAGNNASVTKEVREYVATAPHKSFVKAEAFVIGSLAQHLLASFYNKINKPIVPTGFFKNKQEAEYWLKNIK